MNNLSCPLCETPIGEYFLPVADYKIYKCTKCGLEHTLPVPSLTELKSFYANYENVRAPSDVVILNAKRNLTTLQQFGYKQDDYILDFGTGEGDFVEVAGKNCFGIDFNSPKHSRIYENLADLPIKKFDFLTLWGVLEHFPNPKQIFLELQNYLNPNAIVAITTVNAEGLIPYYYKPIEHLTYWTRNSFEELFSKISLTTIKYETYMMMQCGDIYLDRLLSRTPAIYKPSFEITKSLLPQYVEVPTNEVLVLAKFKP